jgi:carboxymethylenebutenolidase
MEAIDLTDRSSAKGGSVPLGGELAIPSGEGPWPGLVMIHEAFGLDEVMRGHAERLAGAGFLTLAVDLFSAGGPLRCLVATMSALMKGRGRALADIDTARQWLTASAHCTGKVGVIGFCMGGGFALLTASGGFDASAPNYGQVPRHAERALAGACPIVASYGGRDRTLKGAAAKLEKALTDLGVVHDVKEYPGAGHGFLNDAETGPRPLRPLLRVAGVGPDPEAAREAWPRIEAFLAEHLR